MTSIREKEFEGNVVFDDDDSTFSPIEAEYTVAERQAVFSFSRLLNAVLWLSVGLGTLIFGVYHAWLMYNVHEAQTHFSHITTLEREVSFRTECGFYYSYYKQLVEAPTLAKGVMSLTEDKTSEYPTAVNALARFNVHPEVVLAFLYRNFGDENEDPILFYSRCVWVLQGIQASALFLLGVLVSRSVIGGFLSTLLFCHIRPFATRAYFTVSLRENFSMPFFWLRLVFLTILYRSHVRLKHRSWCLLSLSLVTFCFASSWQLSPFLLFAQGLPLYGGAIVNALDMGITQKILLCDAVVLFIVGLLHFAYPLFLSSPAITFACLVYLSNRYWPPLPSNQRRFWSTLARCVLLFVGAVFTSGFMKSLLGVNDDNHVFKLLLAKLNLAYHHDFDVNMYLASSVFRALPPSFFFDLTLGAFLLYPIYAVCHGIFLLGILKVFEETTMNRKLSEYEAKKKDLDENQLKELEKDKPPPSLLAYLMIKRPELSMHALVCAPMAALGVFIQRLQLLWTPHMCIFYGWVLATPAIYTLIPLPTVLRKWFPRIMRYAVPVFVILVICSGYIPAIKRELGPEMRQTFSDPETVQMMEWIKHESRPSGVFSGSMQLMSAVRLSTGRSITNHPHYENGDLRLKTRTLYQAMYGRSTVSQAHEILSKYGVDYIVLEPSICFAPDEGHPFASFRMVDMLDQANGDQPEQGPYAGDPRLKAPTNVENPNRIKLFCEAVQPDQGNIYTDATDDGLALPSTVKAKFRRVFVNPTFWIYEVLH